MGTKRTPEDAEERAERGIERWLEGLDEEARGRVVRRIAARFGNVPPGDTAERASWPLSLGPAGD